MIVEINDVNDSRVKEYVSLTEAQLRNCYDDKGLFIAESPKVIKVAIQNGYSPVSMLCEARHITGDAAEIINRYPDMPVFTGDRQTLSQITGYTLTRGVLCAMRRLPLPLLEDVCRNASIVCVLQSVTDTTNIGAIFRSASALGVDAVILSADTCDPLNRRAVRVSMGTVFTVPWTIVEKPVEELKSLGFKTAALALKDNAIGLEDKILKKQDRLAVIFGTEGDGLSRDVIDGCDYVVKIPMSHGVDSLNVASAAAVTFWELRKS